jgi:hypothetical protein
MKELRGGKSYQKLGYIDYNLSDYFNKAECINRVLKEYDCKTRLANSYLKIKLIVNENSLKIPKSSGLSPTIQQKCEKTSLFTFPFNSNTENSRSMKIICNTNEHSPFTPSHSRNSSKGSGASLSEKVGHQR